MKNLKSMLLKGVAVAGLTASFAASSFAVSGGGNGCSVTRVNTFGSTFFVPSGGNGQYNILGWGNGTGATVGGYDGLLESIARQCILVAAANTSNSGTGREVETAVNEAKSRYANLVGSNPKVCTSGHSQGGGGAFNAANRLGADCVIGLQPDTVYTTSIYRSVGSNVDVACIFSTLDTLAPALPFNSLNCRRNSTRYTERLTSGTHFSPLSGDGGSPGDAMRSLTQSWLAR